MVCLVGKRGQSTEDTKLCFICNGQKILYIIIYKITCKLQQVKPLIIDCYQGCHYAQGDWASTSRTLGYFLRKQKNFLDVQFPAFYSHIPRNLKA